MRLIATIAALTALAVAGCSNSSNEKSVSTNVDMWQDELPIRGPWLRDQLPDNALVYVRVPNLLGLVATPKGNVLDPALRSRANVENVEKIRKGLAENVLATLPALNYAQVSLMLRHLRSPIEVAGQFIPAPGGIVAVTLDIDSNDGFESLVGALGFSLAAPLDVAGTAEIVGAGVPAFARFEAASGRLLVMAGPGANERTFDELLDNLGQSGTHPMQNLERRVDDSGQGFIVWLNAREALPAMQMFVPIEQYQAFVDAGLDKLDAVAYGLGASNGKSRLSLVADVSEGRDLLPVIDNPLALRSVGLPDGLILGSIPDMDYVNRMLASPFSDDEDRANWQDMNDVLSGAANVTIEDLFLALGPEFAVVFDRAGDYLAIRLRDPDAWNDVLQRISAAIGSEPDTFERAGKTYFHWSAPGELSFIEQESDVDLGWAGEMLSRPRDHYFWVREGDYLYVAGAPQILFDRALLGADTDVGEWLSDSQRMDGTHSILSLSGTSRKIPARLYAAYVEIIQVAADLAEADIDVWAMPTAAELGLPEHGSYGLSLTIDDPTVALELTFENNPAEMLGGLGGVATLGGLAAIALPAYQDYTTRAKISMGLALAAETEAAIGEIYATEGRLPDAREADVLSMNTTDVDEIVLFTVEADTGVINIDYAESVVGGGRLSIAPTVNEYGLTWDCYGTFEDRHLPAACRQ